MQKCSKLEYKHKKYVSIVRNTSKHNVIYAHVEIEFFLERKNYTGLTMCYLENSEFIKSYGLGTGIIT